MEHQTLGHILTPLKRIHIELTNICNFDCVFCPKSEMRRPSGFMDTKLAKRLVVEVGSKNIAEKVTFHVMGEPTMHPHFIEILDCAQEEGVKVGLTTNGSLLGGKIGEKLTNYPLFQIDISLQTPDESSYALRKAGSLSFDQYLNDILGFFSAYKQRYGDTIFKFRFLNTWIKKKSLEAKVGPIDVMSSTKELRQTFNYWTNRIYDILDVDEESRLYAMGQIKKLVAYKWNVVEIFPRIFFETYILEDWGHAFSDEEIRSAWAGYCFGMRDHFSVLHNGDVTLCCVDFDGQTAMGNLNTSTLEDILSSPQLGEIINGFKHYRIVHPYCRRCLGSRSFSSWLLKPVASILALKTLKPFFYNQSKLFRN